MPTGECCFAAVVGLPTPPVIDGVRRPFAANNKTGTGTPSTRYHDVFRSSLRLMPLHHPQTVKHLVMQCQEVDVHHLCQCSRHPQFPWTARPPKSIRQCLLTHSMSDSHVNRFFCQTAMRSWDLKTWHILESDVGVQRFVAAASAVHDQDKSGLAVSATVGKRRERDMRNEHVFSEQQSTHQQLPT